MGAAGEAGRGLPMAVRRPAMSEVPQILVAAGLCGLVEVMLCPSTQEFPSFN